MVAAISRMISHCAFACAFVPSLLVWSLAASAAENRPPLDPRKPLIYRNAAGQLQPVTTPGEWKERRAEVLAHMQEIMGPLPGAEKRCPLEVRVLRERDEGTYLVHELTYQSEPECITPALLFLPADARRRTDKSVPAALALHPTHMEKGHRLMTAAGANSSYGIELAQRGYVTIAPAYPLMGEYQPDLRALGYASGTMKAIWDNLRALDLLATLPFVKDDRFAAIGHSLGGHNAIFTAVFEPRIAIIVSSCGFDSFLDYYDGAPAMWVPGKGWTQERYMPRLAQYAERLPEIPFDFHELIAALAPRPVWINAPRDDSNFRARSVDEIVAAARGVYALHGAERNLHVAHPDCPHEFPPALRELAYRAIDASLR